MSKSLEQELREELTESVKRHPSETLLCSGGLDSSILATLSPSSNLVTVVLDNFGSDLYAVQRVANFLKRSLTYKIISKEEAIENVVPSVVRTLKTFDPAILNDLPIYFGMRMVKASGFNSVMTGDGSDELFAGYSYMWNIDDLNTYIRRRIIPFMSFSSKGISKAFGLHLSQPYLDDEIVRLALKIPKEMKVRRVQRGQVGDVYIEKIGAEARYRNSEGELWGKVILREAFNGCLPQKTLWRQKADLMFGSGMYKLEDEIAKRVSDDELKKKRERYGIKWWEPPSGDTIRFRKLQLYLYEVFRREVGGIPRETKYQRECNYCGAGLPKIAPHCNYCGASLPVAQLVFAR